MSLLMSLAAPLAALPALVTAEAAESHALPRTLGRSLQIFRVSTVLVGVVMVREASRSIRFFPRPVVLT
jgi:hypothetical protein